MGSLRVKADDGTVLGIEDVKVRQGARRTYLLRVLDPEFGRLSAVVSTICLENPGRLQDAKGYIAQHVVGIDNDNRFPYNSYPRIQALYQLVSRCEQSRKER